MIKIGSKIINVSDYSVTEKTCGIDTLVFEIDINDDIYPSLVEEAVVIDGTQRYLIKSVDADLDTAKITCEIDMDEWKAEMLSTFSTETVKSMAYTLNQIKPAGWTIIDNTQVTKNRLIECENVTSYDILLTCLERYGFVIRIDNAAKTVKLLNPDNYEPCGVIAMEGLNLQRLSYKGKTEDFITRIYCEGADGLTFADLNNGKNYVEDLSYCNKIISYYWKDERYTDAQSLLDDAKAKVKASSHPVIQYKCDVDDLAKQSDDYKHLTFNLLTMVTLLDSARKSRVNMQVVEYERHPHNPHLNSVTLSTEISEIKGITRQLNDAIANEKEERQTAVQRAYNQFNETMKNASGFYTTVEKDEAGAEIYYMHNKPDKEASDIIWKMTSEAFAVSNDGGVTWSAGIAVNGEVIAQILSATGINAEWITVGQIAESQLDSATQDKLNAEIGGINLIRNSAELTGSGADWSWAGLTGTGKTLKLLEGSENIYGMYIERSGLTANAYTQFYYNYGDTTDKTLNVGETYTASIWYYCDSSKTTLDGQGISFSIQSFNDANVQVRNGYGRVIALESIVYDKWTRIECTFTITNATEHYLKLVPNLYQNGNVIFAKPQLETGTKATSYAPSPEDANAKLVKLESQAVGGRNLLLKTATAFEIAETSDFVSVNKPKQYSYSPVVTDDPKAFLLSLKDGQAMCLSFDIDFPRVYNNASVTGLSYSRVGVAFGFRVTHTDGTFKTWYGTHSGLATLTNKDNLGINSLQSLTSTETSIVGHYAGYTIPTQATNLKDLYANPDNYTVEVITPFVECRAYTTGGTIKNLMLEVGTMPSEYQQAPEDISVENIYTKGTTTIDGGKITTGSIEADKLNVKDLSALNATIAGFDIEDNSITCEVENATVEENPNMSLYYNTDDFSDCGYAKYGYPNTEFKTQSYFTKVGTHFPYILHSIMNGVGVSMDFTRFNPTTTLTEDSYSEANQTDFENATISFDPINNRFLIYSTLPIALMGAGITVTGTLTVDELVEKGTVSYCTLASGEYVDLNISAEVGDIVEVIVKGDYGAFYILLAKGSSTFTEIINKSGWQGPTVSCALYQGTKLRITSSASEVTLTITIRKK